LVPPCNIIDAGRKTLSILLKYRIAVSFTSLEFTKGTKMKFSPFAANSARLKTSQDIAQQIGTISVSLAGVTGHV
jgi:hypothetical protein